MDVIGLADIPPWEWPQDAGDRLLNALRSGAPEDLDRELTIRLAGDITVIDDDLSSALMTIIGSPAETDEVRGAAAIALGPVLEEMEFVIPDDPDDDPPISGTVHAAVRRLLHQTYLDAGAPKLVRRRALEASVRSTETWHEAAVRAAWHSGDGEWRVTAAFAMAFVAGFTQEIMEALDSDDSLIHYHAVVAAGDREVQEAWPHVAALLRRRGIDKTLLLAAIESAAALRPDEARDLLGRFLDSRDSDIVDAVNQALANYGALDEDDDELYF